MDFNKPAHEVTKGDPRVDGPYLDDVRRFERTLGRNVSDDALTENDAPVADETDDEVVEDTSNTTEVTATQNEDGTLDFGDANESNGN